MSSFDIKKLGSILGVWAHPDDESFMMAGLMAEASQNGQKVALLTATKGEEGSWDEKKWPSATLGAVRAKELEAALKILGVKTHHWLNYHDGQCKDVSDSEGTARVLEFINKYRPDTIITFPPDGITGHDDHKAVSRWTRAAIKKSGLKITLYYAVDTQENYDQYFKEIDEKFNFYFNIDKPVLIKQKDADIVNELTEDLAKKKMLALKAQTSQTEEMYKQFGEDLFTQALKIETFVKADQRNPAKWPK